MIIDIFLCNCLVLTVQQVHKQKLYTEIYHNKVPTKRKSNKLINLSDVYFFVLLICNY